ncbi:helix-turn-helix transcriptional regulator [Chitinophaga sp. OAE865]|uniref:helix-turn-helix domain-containing protein n=1 Tax=Chitinophaga sp. OAE865 TaxID=2817898 RepID=UPI001AE67CD9
MQLYNHHVIKIIRKSLKLTQHEMSNMLGISRACLNTYENGRSKGIRDFFFERMIAQFGIDLRRPDNPHRIVFVDCTRVPLPVYQYLSTLEINET